MLHCFSVFLNKSSSCWVERSKHSADPLATHEMKLRMNTAQCFVDIIFLKYQCYRRGFTDAMNDLMLNDYVEQRVSYQLWIVLGKVRLD